MSLRALDADTEYHADLALRAQAAKGTTAMLHIARFYGRLEKSKDYDDRRDLASSAICGAQSEAELADVLAELAKEMPDASSSTRRKWARAAETRRKSLTR